MQGRVTMLHPQGCLLCGWPLPHLSYTFHPLTRASGASVLPPACFIPENTQHRAASQHSPGLIKTSQQIPLYISHNTHTTPGLFNTAIGHVYYYDSLYYYDPFIAAITVGSLQPPVVLVFPLSTVLVSWRAPSCVFIVLWIHGPLYLLSCEFTALIALISHWHIFVLYVQLVLRKYYFVQAL